MRRRIALLSAFLVSTVLSLGSAHAEENTTAIVDSGTFPISAQQPTAAVAQETAPIANIEFSCSPVTREREICLSAGPPTQEGGKTASLLSASESASDLTCSAMPTEVEYKYSRFGACLGNFPITVTETKNGVPVGHASLQVTAQMTLDPKSLTWKESIVMRYLGFSGELTTTTFGVSFNAACNRSCSMVTASPWEGNQKISPLQTLTGEVAYRVGTPNSGFNGGITTDYRMRFTQAGTIPIDTDASWTNPRQIRCDNTAGDAAGTPSSGCVIPSVPAVVPMTAQSSDPGGAVAAYQWAQQNLNDGWGKGKPLTRVTSGVADRTNLACGSFQALTDLVATDTCGAFPFAEALQGGIDGAQCVEVIPHLGNGEWDTYVLGDSRELDRTKPCVRAHVSADDKRFADTQLVKGFANQRVINFDQFEVEFTTPDTGPHGRCLDTTPAGSLPNGDGWILNTTEAVTHVNKTITPIGPAGTRPTQAQACLGKTPVKGSPASGDITGWQDAQEFNRKNPPTSSQARCHLIANILGGKGQILDGGQNNLVPCWQTGMNTGTPSMRTYETMAQNLLQGDVSAFGVNDAIFYQVTPVYTDATSTIPVGVTMNASIERANGTTEELFPNVYVPNTKGNTGLLNLGN
ncbi:DNA/RNA non-specific endonuclease [Streptomyces clavifer]|uniref:DNA/RNA non-specific endonuclease n=1 Tax=Streptomyces clavifer TaxID=68188 RepID=UPI00365CACFE